MKDGQLKAEELFQYEVSKLTKRIFGPALLISAVFFSATNIILAMTPWFSLTSYVVGAIVYLLSVVGIFFFVRNQCKRIVIDRILESLQEDIIRIAKKTADIVREKEQDSKQ